MIKNPVKITGSLQEKVKKLLECAGWHEEEVLIFL